MNFELTEDRRMLADSLSRYLREQYTFDTRRQIAESAQGYSSTHWQALADLGIIGALFSEAHGGYGGKGFDLAVVFEELGRALVVEPFLQTVLAGRLLAAAGEAGSRAAQALAERVITGQDIVAFAHGEPQAPLDALHVCTRATRSGPHWILTGQKAVVWQAEAASALVISARTAGDPTDTEGLSLFLVPADAAGLSLRGYPLIDGGRGAELELDQVQLEADALIGPEGGAWPAIERALGAGIVALCAEALGAMDAARQMTLQYLQERRQFGQPLGAFQALQHRMVELLLEIEQARSAVIRAAAELDNDNAQVREQALSMAKYTIGQAGCLVAEEAIQLHGGIGMTWELPLSHYAKRLIMIDHQLGDADFHLQRYIALGRASAAG
ncbi:acyl-CoA dehydrogenase family protein [Castellaniella sp.]|uniref:acyl-CoA dehydrogenase family protein n=1 Tax=Castellaniella sp. TaxID=1955812 RepID=UPI00356104A7